ncbi:MAG: thioredoxin domain-containing protein [Nitrospinota bacterium]
MNLMRLLHYICKILLLSISGAILGAGLWANSNPAVAESAEGGAKPAEKAQRHPYTNRLIDSNNPYLLLHADNPVDWYPWGPEAFARAKRENKPIFLSVGYSTCYWCHVAERTLYSNPDVAKLMNQWFINVKVDREQRPDIDQIYMLARRILTGSGGWPNNVFLTPDLKPFFAGSYFPAADDPSGRPGFTTVLRTLHRAWTTQRERVLSIADRAFAAMKQVRMDAAGSPEAPVKPTAWLTKARETLSRLFDTEYGGFRYAKSPAKFPQEPMLGLILTDYVKNDKLENLEMLTRTLDVMAYGGIHDHLGGGFHRYSTDRTWSVPHFEKMLHNNAQLLEIYARAYEAMSNPLYARVAIDVAEYLRREMMSPQGGFFTAKDSQVSGEEGASYLWDRQEIEAVLGAEETRKFFTVYELTPMPARSGVGRSTEPTRGALRVRLTVANTQEKTSTDRMVEMLSALKSQRLKLLGVRNRRPQPALDEKIVVSLNGLAIQAFAKSGQIFDNPRYVTLARRAAERVWALAFDPKTGELKHEIFHGHAQTEAYLADYALLGKGFMALYDVTKQDIWLKRAAALADSILQRFAREEGSLLTTFRQKDLLIPLQDTGDQTHPSGASATIDLLLRLSAATGNPRYTDAASRTVRRLSGQIEQSPESWAAAVEALNLHPIRVDDRVASTVGKFPTATGERGTASRLRLPTTADHVRATAVGRTGRDDGEIAVTLHIDEGYHINANPASLDYLIPTSVAFNDVTPTRIIYPRAVRFEPEFAPQALNVYEDTVVIVAKFQKGILKEAPVIRGKVIAQACNNHTCLPPAELPVVVNDSDPNSN